MIKFCRNLIVLLTITAMAWVLGGCFMLPSVDTPLEPPAVAPVEIVYSSVTVKRDNLIDERTTTASIAAEKGMDAVLGDVSGTIDHIYVQIGDKVKKGQILLDLISEGDLSKYAVDQQKKQLQIEEIQYEQFKLNNTDPDALKIAQLQIEMSRSRYRELMDRLARRQVKAPMDGIVEFFFGDNIREGSPVEPDDNLIHIMDPSKLVMYIVNKAEGLKEGMMVDVSLGGTTYPVKVLRVPTIQDKTEINGMENLYIMLDMSTLPKELCKHGTIVSVHYVLEQKEKVLVLPQYAIKTIDGRQFVSVKVDNIWQDREIEVGIRMATEVEITKGLQEGDIVLVNN